MSYVPYASKLTLSRTLSHRTPPPDHLLIHQKLEDILYVVHTFAFETGHRWRIRNSEASRGRVLLNEYDVAPSSYVLFDISLMFHSFTVQDVPHSTFTCTFPFPILFTLLFGKTSHLLIYFFICFVSISDSCKLCPDFHLSVAFVEDA